MPTIKSQLSGIYSSLLPGLFDTEIPEEGYANCADCVMIDGAEHDSKSTFNGRTKCCTFYPVLPNFIVGGILSDRSAGLKRGRQRIDDAITAGIGVYPHGLFPPRFER